MEFRVGDIKAKCAKCESTQFKTPDEEESGPHAKYYCAKCNTTTTYAELMSQIGREALRRRREKIAVAKAR
jgi:transposase-like protein